MLSSVVKVLRRCKNSSNSRPLGLTPTVTLPQFELACFVEPSQPHIRIAAQLAEMVATGEDSHELPRPAVERLPLDSLGR